MINEPIHKRGNFQIRYGIAGAGLLSLGLLTSAAVGQGPGNIQSFRNSAGILRTFSSAGGIDRSNPFFKPIGRAFPVTCEHCHFASEAWGISGSHAAQLFNSTAGAHPLFTAPTGSDFLAAQIPANVSTLAQKRTMYNLMIDKGLALVRRTWPAATADFSIMGVIPPAGFAVGQNPTMIPTPDGAGMMIDGAWYLAYTASSNGGVPQIWTYRRPIPTTNFRFVTTASWDGQDTRQFPDPIRRPTSSGIFDISNATIRGRETGPSLIAFDGHVILPAEQAALAQQIVDFMFSTTTSQDSDTLAGALNANGASGGISSLINNINYYGINDVLEGDLKVVPIAVSPFVQEIYSGAPFTGNVFNLYDGWAGSANAARASIARGQALFNQTNRMNIDDVNGIQSYNRTIGVGGIGTTGASITFPDSRVVPGLSSAVPGSLAGCVTCHDAPNIGNHSTRLAINIGVADVLPATSANNANVNFNNSGLPVFYLRQNSTGDIVKITDPGRATISGRWAHIGQFKGPVLRGLVNRAPFFHSGAAADLKAVIDFYSVRFGANFTSQETTDLVAFLKTL